MSATLPLHATLMNLLRPETVVGDVVMWRNSNQLSALHLLADAGLAVEIPGGDFRLLWDVLEARQIATTGEPA